MNKHQFLAHPSELKIRAQGEDLPELFINSASGMMVYIYGDLPSETDRIDKIEISSQNLETLLVDWLSEILRLSDTNKRAYIHFRIIELTSDKIRAEIASAKVIAQNDIKAVTYHELAIIKKKDCWEATVVYDV